MKCRILYVLAVVTILNASLNVEAQFRRKQHFRGRAEPHFHQLVSYPRRHSQNYHSLPKTNLKITKSQPWYPTLVPSPHIKPPGPFKVSKAKQVFKVGYGDPIAKKNDQDTINKHGKTFPLKNLIHFNQNLKKQFKKHHLSPVIKKLPFTAITKNHNHTPAIKQIKSAIHGKAFNTKYSKKNPYTFSYGVRDSYHGLNYGHAERKNGRHVQGMYYVHLPDGRTQKVSYYTDDWGYHPTITYEGKAFYPSKKSKGSY